MWMPAVEKDFAENAPHLTVLNVVRSLEAGAKRLLLTHSGRNMM